MVNTILLELVQPIILTLVLPVIPKSLRLKVIVELILVTSLLVALQLVQLISKYRVVVSDTMVTLIGACAVTGSGSTAQTSVKLSDGSCSSFKLTLSS